MEKLSWNAHKKELWKLNPSQLMEKLQELQTQLFKDNNKIRMGSKRQACTEKNHVDLKGLRHKIACIKTMLNVKLRRDNQ